MSGATLAPAAGNARSLIDAQVVQRSERTWWTRLRRDKVAMGALIILVAIALMAVCAPLFNLADPIDTDPRSKNAPILSEGHPLGADQVGRDILSRIVWGARTTLMLGVVTAAFSTIVGLALGLTAGYFGGWIDTIISRFIDVLLSFPSILLAIIIVAVLGPSLQNALIAIAILGVPFYVRLVRGEVMRFKSMDFVVAAQTVGASQSRIVLKHILPNVIAPIIVTSSIHIGYLILEAGGLSFLGLGAQPPSPEWGAMIASGRNQLLIAPHVVLVPATAIFIVVLCFNILGDGLRDAFDPKTID